MDSGSRSTWRRYFALSVTSLSVLASSVLMSPSSDAGSSSEGTWITIAIDDVENPYQDPNLAVDSQGGVHFVYWLGYTQRTLAYAYRTSEGDLSITEVAYDNCTGIAAPNAFVAVDPDANAHIVYSTHEGLYSQYSSNSEGGWYTANLSAQFGVTGGGDIAVDSLGQVWIVTVSETSEGELVLLKLASGEWTYEVVSGCRPLMYAIALSPQDDVHICYTGYSEADEYGLWHVTGSGTTWTVTRVDPAQYEDDFSGRPSIAADGSGNVLILVYANTVVTVSGQSSDVLFYASVEQVPYWLRTLMNTDGRHAPGKALAVASDGGVHVIYNCDGSSVYGVFHPESGLWGWKDSPGVTVSSIALDEDDSVHLVKDQYPLFPSYQVGYVSNGFRVPDAPQAVHAEADGVNVTLSWTPPLSNGGLTVDSYSLEAAEMGSDNIVRADVPWNITSFTFTGLTPEADYRFTVVAVNQLGESDPSLSVNATTGPEPTTDDESWVILGSAAAALLCVMAIVVWSQRGRRRTGQG